MPDNPNLHANNFRALLLFLLALVNYVLMYATNILLARSLVVGEFDDYSVALSINTMLATVATLGLEKYALRAIALYIDQQDWQRLRGFLLFSISVISAFSLILMVLLSVSLEVILAIKQADYHLAIVIFAVFLPIIALTLFLVEVIAARGAYLLSVILYRVALPVIYVGLLVSLLYSPIKLSAVTAVVCFGCAWASVFFIMAGVAKVLLPVEIVSSTARWQGKKWLKGSLPLVMNSLMLTVMTSSGVVILELLFPSELEVGIYAVAAQTGGFISLLGTSTNRYYLPKMSVLIEHREQAAIQKLMQQRAWVVGSIVLLLLLGIYYFGQTLLGLFGKQFSQGYYAMVVIAVGASASALYADIPYYLQFMGFHRRVLGLTWLATLSMLMLSFFLGKTYGALGVAVAYMVPVVLLFVSLRLLAARCFRQLRASPL